MTSALARLLTFAAFFAAAPALAQDSVDISFAPGATSTTINGTIIGNEYIDYVVNARAGQTMVVSLGVTGTNGNGTVMFNIVPSGQDFPAIYNGGMDGTNRAEVVLPESRDWAIRVYLMGNDRDTGKTVGYSIDVYIAPDAAGGGTSAPAASGDSTSEERVRFAAGTNGAELTGELLPGASRRYVLGASDGQTFYFRLAANGPGMSYQIFNPDGTFLLDQMPAAQEYRGDFWQTGDHVVEVINRGNIAQSYNVIFGIQ